MRMQKKGAPAYLTVYLALIMSVLLSLCLALIEGARSNAIRLEAECIADIGMNSVLAEYHRELFRQYNLFAIDSSYGAVLPTKANTEHHLQQYIERNLSMEDIFLSDFLYKDFLAMSLEQSKGIEVTKVSILTDGNGEVFRRRAVDAVKDDVGIALLEQIAEWTETISSQGLESRDVAAEKRAVDQQLQSYDGKEIQIAEEEWVTVEITNPTAGLEQLRNKGILQTVIEFPEQLSSKSVVLSGLIEERMQQGSVNQGNIQLEELSEEEQLLQRFFFQEYLLRYMGRYGQEKEESALSYQMEYLLVGKNSDIENLRSIANRLCAIREAANVIYLFSDQEKCLEAEALATVLATLCCVPEAVDVFELVILFGWSYAESLYDVKTILSGGQIPLMKNDATWHYSLEKAVGAQVDAQQDDMGTGLSYEDYLRVFMMVTDLDILTGRAMNMVEADIRLTPGNENFRLDGCFDGIEACIRIQSAYGYEYEITRQKFYSLY